jgi:hypothetical protein
MFNLKKIKSKTKKSIYNKRKIIKILSHPLNWLKMLNSQTSKRRIRTKTKRREAKGRRLKMDKLRNQRNKKVRRLQIIQRNLLKIVLTCVRPLFY